MARDAVLEIKNRLSILDVVGAYVKLKRAGKSHTGLCPFHKEKSPSFHVSVERGTYHCFGCGEGGDAFSFIEKVEGVDFRGALKILAEKAGVEIEYDPHAREARSQTERLREVMSAAANYYAAQLTPASEAYAYALKRGLSAETIKSWQIGFAPDAWRALLEGLAAQSISLEELRAAGLVKEADGKPGTYYDRFRNRLIFPIRDGAGRVVAFTGRALASDEAAKYLNSPETDLYHKSEILFGLDRAKDAIRTRGFALLVEGQMDLLHAHQAGFENTIALSGTALTDRHLALLKRYSDNLMLALDADAAGLTATAKSAELALKAGMRVKAILLPTGKDPADLISEDAKDFAKRTKEAKPVVEFFLAVLSERERDSHRLVQSAERVVLPLIRAIASPMEREHFIGIAARALGLSTESVRESVGRAPSKEPERMAPARPSARSARETLLRAVVAAYPGSPLASRVEAEYARITEAPLPTEAPPELALFEAEQTFGVEPLESAADELLHAFEEAVIREAYQEAVSKLRQAESSGDAARIASAQEVCSRLSSRLGALKK